MATRWKDGLQMVTCDEAGVRLFVVKQNRFNKTLKVSQKTFISWQIRRIALVTVNVWQRPQSYYDQASWRGT